MQCDTSSRQDHWKRHGQALATEAVRERLPLYGPLDVADISKFYTISKRQFAHLFKMSCPYQVGLEDFQILCTLGKGAFGNVILVQQRKSLTYLAMKALKKETICKKNQIEHVLNEKRILQSIDFPFCVRMEYYSTDNSYIYFFMPFISGGEMFSHLEKLGKFEEEVAIFYAAQVVLGLEYLHSLSLIYRDLKPENLLIDHLGYIKITDFGFTKPVMSRTYTFCGTPHYLAPEIILGHGYGTSVDWWALGVLIYEMNCGRPPFDSENHMKIYTLILANKPVVPPEFGKALRDIVENLLQTDLTKRFGNLYGRADDIKNHAWFSSVDWLMMFNRMVSAPYIPCITGERDLTNFTSRSHKLPVLNVDAEIQYENEFKDF